MDEHATVSAGSRRQFGAAALARDMAYEEQRLAEHPRVHDAFVLSVIVPVFNERFTLRELVRRVRAVDIPKEIILVDDGSTDGTRDIAAELARNYPDVRLVVQRENLGKGAAIRRGIAEATGEFLLIQDADLEYDPADYPRLLAPLVSGQADVVYGSRFLAGARRVHLFWHAVANRFLTFLTNLTTNLNLTDMETCYKAFRTDLVRRIPIRSNRFGFEPEITAKLAKLKCRIYEVPISYNGRDYAEGKKIGVTDAFSAVGTILRFWLRADVGDEVGQHTLARMSEAASYNWQMFRAFEQYIGRRVMDVSAGVGNTSRYLLDRDAVLLTDVEDGYLRMLQRRFAGYENVRVRHLDLDVFRGSELRGEALDTILCLNVLEHIPDDRRVLRELFEALMPGGRLILLVPSHPRLFSRLDTNLGHFRRYTRAEVEQEIREAGFDVEAVRLFNWVGAVGWFVYGRILRREHISSIATRGFTLFRSAIAVEDLVNMPFGLSVIAVGRKPTGGSQER